MDTCSANYSKPPTCFDNKNATLLSVLHATVPNCQSGHWQPLTPEWKGAFYTHVVFFGSLFLLLAIVCLILLCKHRTVIRFRRKKTFIAVNVALMILGFSRVIFYALDPYGISGYCNAFACVIVSRLLFSLTFPSLTASYTLVFATLWHVSTVNLRKSRAQTWKVIIPLSFVHYFFAVTVEIICAFSAYSAIFLLLVCEFAFTVWGLVVCATFLVVGLKILKSVKVTARDSSTIRRSSLATHPPIQARNFSFSGVNTATVDSTTNRSTVEESIKLPISPGAETWPQNNDTASSSVSGKRKTFLASRRSKQKNLRLKHHNQAIKKVSIITYAVAVLGGLYSLLGLAQLVLLVMTLFGPCPENESPTGNNPYMWLGFRCVSSLVELLLACLLVYSVNEIRLIFRLFRNLACSILQCRNVFETDNSTANEQPSFSSSATHTLNKTTHSLENLRRGTQQSLSYVPAETVLATSKSIEPDKVPVTANLNGSNRHADNDINNHSGV